MEEPIDKFSAGEWRDQICYYCYYSSSNTENELEQTSKVGGREHSWKPVWNDKYLTREGAFGMEKKHGLSD